MSAPIISQHSGTDDDDDDKTFLLIVLLFLFLLHILLFFFFVPFVTLRQTIEYNKILHCFPFFR